MPRLRTTTELTSDNKLTMKAKRRNSAKTGACLAEAGMMLVRRTKNTTSAAKMEMQIVVFSPASAGRQNTLTLRRLRRTHGMMMLMT